MRRDAEIIIQKTVEDVMPGKAVKESIEKLELFGRVYIAAIGKAAWVMAQAAAECLGNRLEKGVVVTKYEHSRGPLERMEIIEAGHPEPDENSVRGAKKVIELVSSASETDTVLLLISGGGSALTELPLPGLELADVQDVTRQLLRCGADITEINVLRKKLSAIKGGKLGQCCAHTKVYAVILSDILGSNDDMIASGMTYPDESTAEDALAIAKKYGITCNAKIQNALETCVPCKDVYVENHVVGSVAELCRSAAKHAEELGYTPYILTCDMQCEAKEAGTWIASFADAAYKRPFAVIAGGETVVKVTGNGLGGRNQEIALSAASKLAGKENVLLFSLGSDGTDGPTDAVGGIVDGTTAEKLANKGICIDEVLLQNDAYHALKEADGLLITGATGTNVNDVTVLLCK